MSKPPTDAKIYHITHLKNLPRILESDCLYSDSKRIELGLECDLVGMSNIKKRRLEKIEVSCYPGTKVGEFVPFYFCPRSVMLYLLHMGNHPDLDYRGGQEPIIHLQADLQETIAWARREGVRWAFSDANAGAYYSQFYNKIGDLTKVDWAAVANRDFRDPVVKEPKQAEFLVFEKFPWNLIEKIGVATLATRNEMRKLVADDLEVSMERTWYF